MSIARTSITGVLLAGGQSRRMFALEPGSGQRRDVTPGAGIPAGDKGLLDIAGQPMLAHVLGRLAPQVGCVVLNANGDPARFAAFGLPVVEDTVGGFVGPLAGVLAGMRWSSANAPRATHIATVSADAPFIPADLVARLAAAIDGRPGIALASSDGELHPVIGLWPVALADDLEACLQDGMRKVLRWTDRHGTVPVVFGPVHVGSQAVDPFFNANTPAELELARRLLGA